MKHNQCHNHEHDHHSHSHEISQNADQKYLYIALGLLLALMALEIVVGVLVHSLALIADAGHMLTDAGSIGLALVTIYLSQYPAVGHFTFGLKRTEVLSAQANGITLILLSIWFLVEGIMRLVYSPQINGLFVGIVALVGILFNLGSTMALSKANRDSMNIEGSFQHILTDLFAFIATAIAGFAIWWTHWYRFDAIAALIVTVLMLKTGIELLLKSGRVFLEAAPSGLDPETIEASIRDISGVLDIRDLHVWEVGSDLPCLSGNILVDEQADCHAICHNVQSILYNDYGIEHSTIQTEHFNGDYYSDYSSNNTHTNNLTQLKTCKNQNI